MSYFLKTSITFYKNDSIIKLLIRKFANPAAISKVLKVDKLSNNITNINSPVTGPLVLRAKEHLFELEKVLIALLIHFNYVLL